VEPPELDGVTPVGLESGEGEEEDPGELVFESLSCCANGSLLAKRLKDVSWLSCTWGTGLEASELPDPVVGVVAAGALP
jgi:hypothetical protein